jgi:flagellar motility protein MotE (MotC chaperone)
VKISIGGFFAIVVAMMVFKSGDTPPTVQASSPQVQMKAARHPECAGNPEQEKCDKLRDEMANETPAQKKERLKKIADAEAVKEKARKVAEVEAKKEERAEKARKKKEGVVIGISKQDALDSSWGRPNKVNRTTNAHGTREQWVYDGGYLYFEGDTLTSIQN